MIDNIKDYLVYNPETGVFTWKPRPKSKRSTPVAGGETTNGYITIGFKYKHYLAHRLAFYFMTGAFPSGMVDHINRDRTDNRWCNLRVVDASGNNQNRTCNRALPLGIYKIERKGRKGFWYECKIQCKGRQYSTFKRKLEDAIEWRQLKEKELFR